MATLGVDLGFFLSSIIKMKIKTIFFLNATLSVDLFLFKKNAKNATLRFDLFLFCLKTGIFRVIPLVVFGMSTSASGLLVNCVKLFK